MRKHPHTVQFIQHGTTRKLSVYFDSELFTEDQDAPTGQFILSRAKTESKELDWAEDLRRWADSFYWDFGRELERNLLIERIESLLTAKEDALRKAVEGMKFQEPFDELRDNKLHNGAIDSVLVLLTPKKEDENGHKIDVSGKLVFDDRCHGCDARKN